MECTTTVRRHVSGRHTGTVTSQLVISRSGDLLDRKWLQRLLPGGRYNFTRSYMTYGPAFLILYSVGGNTEEETNKDPSTGLVAQKSMIKRRSRSLQVGFRAGFWLDGILGPPDSPLVSYLVDPDKSYQPAKGHDENVVILEGQTELGQLSMTLSVQHDFLPISITLVKGPDEPIPGNQLVKEVPVDPMLGQHFEKLAYKIRDIKPVQVDGSWIAESGRLTMHEEYDSGTHVIDEYVIERSSIKLSPEFDEGQFSSDLPPGTPITFEDERDSDIRYRWNGQWPEAIFNIGNDSSPK